MSIGFQKFLKKILQFLSPFLQILSLQNQKCHENEQLGLWLYNPSFDRACQAVPYSPIISTVASIASEAEKSRR